MPSGREGWNFDDTLLHLADLLVTKMEVCRPDCPLPQAGELINRIVHVRRGDSARLSQGADTDDSYPFIVMPRDCWKRIRRAMRKLAGEVGLTIKEERRYDLKRDQVCLRVVKRR